MGMDILASSAAGGLLGGLMLSVSTFAPLPATAQDTASISDKATCGECRIRTSVRGRLHHEEIFRPPHAVAAAADGRLIVARGGDGPPLVFDSAGRFLAVLGRAGDGPGEYRAVELVVPGGDDTLFLFDRNAHRMSITRFNGQFLNSAPMPDMYSAARTRDGVLVVSGQVADRARFGKPFHIFDASGNYVLSFGDTASRLIPGHTPPRMRWVTEARSHGFWTASVLGQYTLEHWTTDGRMLLRLVRASTWFPRTAEPRYGFSRTEPPSPMILSVVEDESRRLWVAIRVPSAEWRDAVAWPDRAAGERALRPIINDPDRAYDTIFEVIDTKSRRLLASLRVDHGWVKFVGPGRFFSFREDASGEIVVSVHNAWLEIDH